ncbi:MAG: adenylate kinase [Candidatus Binatia bacterium]
MRIVWLGPPGAGKGTQAKLMHDRTGMAHISTGDLLRSEAAAGSALGRIAKGYMDRGELVPDDVVIGMIDQRLRAQGSGPGFMLDGFPRTVAQAEALTRMLKEQGGDIDHVMSLVVGRDELVRRLSGRRTCRRCGAMYHVAFDPPAEPGVCGHCGGELFQRDDDREDTIHARLDVYDKATAPLIAYYRDRGLLREIDGTGTSDEVLERGMRALTPAP